MSRKSRKVWAVYHLEGETRVWLRDGRGSIYRFTEAEAERQARTLGDNYHAVRVGV